MTNLEKAFYIYNASGEQIAVLAYGKRNPSRKELRDKIREYKGKEGLMKYYDARMALVHSEAINL